MTKQKKQSLFFVGILLVALFSPAIYRATIVAGGGIPTTVLTIEEAKEIATESAPKLQMAELGVRRAVLGVEGADEGLDDLQSNRDAVSGAMAQVTQTIAQTESQIDVIQAQIVGATTPAAIDLNVQLDNLIGVLRTSERTMTDLTSTLVGIDRSIDALDAQEEQALDALVLVALAEEETAAETLVSVAESYTALVMLEGQIKIQEAGLEQLSEQVRLQEERLAAGLVAELDVEQMRAQVRAVEAALEVLEHRKMQGYQSLVMLVGRPLDESFAVEHFTPQEPIEVDFEILLEKRLVQDWSVLRANLNLQTVQESATDALGEHGRTSLEYRLEKIAMEEAELDLAGALNNVHTRLLVDYHQLKQAEKSLLNSELDLELAQRQHTAMEIRATAGRITAFELTDSQLQLLEKELALQEAKYNYHNAFSRLNKQGD